MKDAGSLAAVTDVLPPPRDGRSIRWRLGALVVGGLFGCAAVGLYLRPEYLSYLVAAGLALVALTVIASAILAKGR